MVMGKKFGLVVAQPYHQNTPSGEEKKRTPATFLVDLNTCNTTKLLFT